MFALIVLSVMTLVVLVTCRHLNRLPSLFKKLTIQIYIFSHLQHNFPKTKKLKYFIMKCFLIKMSTEYRPIFRKITENLYLTLLKSCVKFEKKKKKITSKICIQEKDYLNLKVFVDADGSLKRFSF